MPDLTPEERDEVCAGAKRWLAKHEGRVEVDSDTARVYAGVCRHGDSLAEVHALWAGDPVDPMTYDRVQAGWASLVGMAEEIRRQEAG